MLVDQYDALRSHRPYKEALGHERVCEILLEGDGRTEPSHFQPELLAAFRSVADRFESIFDSIEDVPQREEIAAATGGLN